MKIILLILALATLPSCDDQSTSFQGEQCSSEFAPSVLDSQDNKWYIPVEGSVCRCRQYRFDLERIGPVRNDRGAVTVIRKPIQECNLIKGYKPSVESKLWATLDWWRVQIKKWIDENETEKPVMEDKLQVEGSARR